MSDALFIAENSVIYKAVCFALKIPIYLICVGVALSAFLVFALAVASVLYVVWIMMSGVWVHVFGLEALPGMINVLIKNG